MKDPLRDIHTSQGVKVRKARERFDWSQTTLAAIVGISPSALSNIEAGRRVASDEVKYRLAGALGVSVGELFPWPEKPPPFPGTAVMKPRRTWIVLPCGHRVHFMTGEKPPACRKRHCDGQQAAA